MKKLNLFGNLGIKTRRLYGVVLTLFALLSFSNITNAQPGCSFVAADEKNISVDQSCEALIEYTDLIKPSPGCSAPYTVSIYSDPTGQTLIIAGTNSVILPAGYAGQSVYGNVEDIIGQSSALVKLNIIDNLAPTIACYGATPTMSGALETTDPTYTRSSSNNPSDGSANCVATGTAGVHYDVFEFTIDQVDDYTFALDGSSAPSARFFVALYKDNFDPANVCDNFLYDDYAPALGGNVTIPSRHLTNVNGKYFLVTTSVGAGQTGGYSWAFSATAGGQVFGKGTTCEYTVYCYENIEDKVKVIGFDNCSNPTTVTITNDVSTQNNCTSGLPNNVIAILDRTYVATDDSGNSSPDLDVQITIEQMPNDTFYNKIFFPEDKRRISHNAVSCSDNYPDDPTYAGHPSPAFTGWPFIVIDNDTTLLDPTSNLGCNLAVTYADQEVTSAHPSCRREIHRIWYVDDGSCNPRRKISFPWQIIEIADTTAPVVTCPPSETVNTNQFNCFDSYQFHIPTVTDNCQGSDWEWKINLLNNSGNSIKYTGNLTPTTTTTWELEPGTNHIKYTVVDACGNSSDCTFDVTVEDKIEPVAVCQTNTTISLTYDGEAQLPAFGVNSGSYDNCSIVELKIKRMDQPSSNFEDYVTYDCSDIATNGNNMVILQVKDAAGNVGTCMVSVEVQDKLAPTINCPDNLEVECDHIYEPDSLTKYFGWPTAHDNCNVTITTDSSTVENACYSNPVKVITRNFTATDDGGRTDECTQTISFVRSKYFGYNDKGVKGNTVGHTAGFGAITWPEDVTITQCIDPNTANDPNSPLHPNQTGRPILDEYSCDQVGSTYSDFLAIDNDNNLDNNIACFKIIRTWTVLDDCHKVKGEFVKWSFDQVIFATNNVDPTMDATPDKSVCTYDTTCTDGHIDLQYTCSDDCTQDEDLRWRYYIDYDNNNAVGVWDFTSPIHSGNNMDASGDYAIGTHKILWQVWDQCGNSIVQEQLFTIINCKKPTPRCIANHVDLTNMPGGPAAMMEASMFDNGSSHTCGYRLIFSFSADTTDKTVTYFCNDLGLQPVFLYVTAVLPDGSIVSQDFCETTCDVQDNFNLCTNPITYGTVSGSVTTGSDKKVEGVTIKLLGSELASVTTNTEGQYAFEGVNEDQSYVVEPNFKNDYLNGLSTLDLVIIQKHLLGIKKIKSPYDLIAADANKDKKLTASDILVLRKLILGSQNVIKNNKAWRFIDKNFKFTNKAKAMAESFPSEFKISNMSDIEVADFIAIKVGDISGDAIVNDEVEGRSNETISFSIDSKRFNSDETVEIPVFANETNDIQGFQTTVSFDATKLEFESIESGLFEINDNNFATNRVKKGYLTISWDDTKEITLNDKKPLFTLIFKANKTGNTEVISFNSDITKSEAYNSSYEVFNVELDYRSGDNNEFVLLQNTPNPFSNSTIIRFNNPVESSFELNIFDLNGRLVFKTSGFAQRGMNTVDINKTNLNVSGVLYYTVSTDTNTATKKMVVLK